MARDCSADNRFWSKVRLSDRNSRISSVGILCFLDCLFLSSQTSVNSFSYFTNLTMNRATPLECAITPF